MPDLSLPEGAYFSIANSVRAQSGGQTRALLMRNRFFTLHGGVQTTLLTFDDAPVYPTERARLTERGELVPGMQLLNIFEHYREAQLGTGTGPALDEPEGLRRDDTEHPDGSVAVTSWRQQDGEVVLLDHRRRDGSVFLRRPGPGAGAGLRRWVLVDPTGRVLHSWARRASWSQHWLRALVQGHQRAFVISDGRFAAQKVMPFADPRFHMIHVMHNVHLHGARRWNSTISPNYTFVMDSISRFDGLVSLTRRQREDVAERFGATDNLFTVGNPVVLPPMPDPRPERAPATFVMASRFDRQKRLDEAVRVFALVVEARPQARLHLYGVGETQPEVRRLIGELGLERNVELRGWDPDAREALWSATAFLLTSAHEGYPLATLESLARGCPVISYDIKYGPQEQITDGLDGYLVPDGDRRMMADRIIALVDAPEQVARMSEAASAGAREHDHRAFLRQWAEVLTTVVEQKPRRVELGEVTCTVHELGYLPKRLPGRLRSRLPGWVQDRAVAVRRGSASLPGSRVLRFRAALEVRGQWPRGALKKAKVTLDAVSASSEVVTRLPVRVTPGPGGTFAISGEFTLARVFAKRSTGDDAVTLRLRLVLRNASWQTVVARPVEDAPPFELSFAPDGRLTLMRAPAADRPATDGS